MGFWVRFYSNFGENYRFFHLLSNEKTFLTEVVLVFQSGELLFKSGVVTGWIRYVKQSGALKSVAAINFLSIVRLCIGDAFLCTLEGIIFFFSAIIGHIFPH